MDKTDHPLRLSKIGVTRLASAMIALPSLSACTARTLAPPESQPQRVENVTFQQTINRQIDILFMVDDSQSMLPLQNKLLTNFPVFMNVLEALPMGLPDVHVAVVSSDTGPGQFDLPQYHCPFGGDSGHFQFQPRGTCTTTPLMAGQTFLDASNNQAVKNYTGDIADAFTCIAALGDQGCGFEGQLKSVRLALDPSNTPDGNLGFLRPQAYLAVILITNEDDCSVPDDSNLIDPTQTLMSDPLGPFWSFRCNEFGHLCNINGTMQPPPRGPAANLQGCVSNDTSTGRLTKVGDEVAFLRGLKADPNQIMVAAITGPATPYSIDLAPNPSTNEQIANIDHSCMLNSGEYADPSVRILQWVEGFGANGLFLPICADSFAPALTTIAQKLSMLLAPQCIQGTLVDEDPTTPTLDPDCTIIDRYFNDQNQAIETALAACASNQNTPPCWSIVDDAMNCPGAQTLNVNRGAATPPSGLITKVSCAMCIAGVGQAGCPCVSGDPVSGCI
jgi:hypothetical protein